MDIIECYDKTLSRFLELKKEIKEEFNYYKWVLSSIPSS